MAVCTVSIEKNSPFLPPVHHGEKKNSKLFSNLASRKMFGKFLTNKSKENDSNDHQISKNFQANVETSTDRRRPLVMNKENNNLVSNKISFNSENYQRIAARSQSPVSAKSRKSLNSEGSKVRPSNEVDGPTRFHSPPKIINVSGQLSSERIRDMIKPIPCKPLTPSCLSVRMASSHDCLPYHDEGYNSQNISSSSAATTSSSSSSNTSSNFLPDEANNARQSRQLRPRPKSSTVSCAKKQSDEAPLKNCGGMSEMHVNNCSSTFYSFQPRHRVPQQITNGLLNVKEVRGVCNRMEVNERVLTSVFQTKEREWMKEVEELDEKWREKMRWQQEKSVRSEQNLLSEIMELRRENNVLTDRLNDSERDKTTVINERNEAENSVQQLKQHLELAHWQTTQKLNEIVSLRPHATPNGRLKTAISTQNLPKFVSSPSPCVGGQGVEGHTAQSSRRRSVGGKKASKNLIDDEYFSNQLDDVVSQMEDLKKQNELEHYVWMCEKSKVIEYQKKLQSTYVEICHKNRLLQDDVIRLRRKLEMNSLGCVDTESFC